MLISWLRGYQDICSVNNATLNRFFALHFVLPFVLAALVLMHLIALHDSAGSGNPLGVSGNYDRLPFAPYFVFKDLITVFIFIIVLSLFVFFMPNVLGDSENYVMANPMQTPAAIVPEWYLLPFYAILRSIPNKLLGVIAMFSAILIILSLPFTDISRFRGMQYNQYSISTFYFFVANLLILLVLGAKHVESPFIQFGQISALLYFVYFGAIFFISLIENTIVWINCFSGKGFNSSLTKSNTNLISIKYNSSKSLAFLPLASLPLAPLTLASLPLASLPLASNRKFSSTAMLYNLDDEANERLNELDNVNAQMEEISQKVEELEAIENPTDADIKRCNDLYTMHSELIDKREELLQIIEDLSERLIDDISNQNDE